MDGRAQTTGIRQRGKEATCYSSSMLSRAGAVHDTRVRGRSEWSLLIDTNIPTAKAEIQNRDGLRLHRTISSHVCTGTRGGLICGLTFDAPFR